jgi:hypothetical protein
MTVTGERQFEKRLFPAGLADVTFVCCVIMIRWRSMTVTGERKFENELGVAVGTILTNRPPHRSVRAELPHTALPLDSGVEESAHSALPL